MPSSREIMGLYPRCFFALSMLKYLWAQALENLKKVKVGCSVTTGDNNHTTRSMRSER